jgi:hypothetical protein
MFTEMSNHKLIVEENKNIYFYLPVPVLQENGTAEFATLVT